MTNSISNPLLNKLQEKSADLLDKDLRQSPLKIYSIFQLYDIYTDGAFQTVLKGTRVPNDSIVYNFFNNIFDVAALYTRDFSYLEDDIDELEEKRARAIKETGRNITNGDISYWLYGSLPNIKRSFLVLSKTTCSIADILDFKLIPTMHFSTITKQYIYYRQMLYAIMRALAHDGLNILTQEELAEKTKIDLEYIKHPENLCRNKDLFFESLNKITAEIVPYNQRIISSKRRRG